LNAVRDTASHGPHNGAGVAVAYEDHISQVLPLTQPDNIVDVYWEAGSGTQLGGSIRQSGESQGMHCVAVGFEKRGHPIPGPSPEPGSGNQHEIRDVAVRRSSGAKEHD
jgi:hypothetical protein